MGKGFFYTLMLAAFALGSIGGFGYTLYCGAYPIAFGVLVLTYMAFPKAKEYFEKLTN